MLNDTGKNTLNRPLLWLAMCLSFGALTLTGCSEDSDDKVNQSLEEAKESASDTLSNLKEAADESAKSLNEKAKEFQESLDKEASDR